MWLTIPALDSAFPLTSPHPSVVVLSPHRSFPLFCSLQLCYMSEGSCVAFNSCHIPYCSPYFPSSLCRGALPSSLLPLSSIITTLCCRSEGVPCSFHYLLHFTSILIPFPSAHIPLIPPSSVTLHRSLIPVTPYFPLTPFP